MPYLTPEQRDTFLNGFALGESPADRINDSDEVNFAARDRKHEEARHLRQLARQAAREVAGDTQHGTIETQTGRGDEDEVPVEIVTQESKFFARSNRTTRPPGMLSGNCRVQWNWRSAYHTVPSRRDDSMSNAKIDVVGPAEIPLVAELYGQVYRPPRSEEFFRRRFLGRYNPLILVAHLDDQPVGFFVGFELKPSVFFAWLYGVTPDCRRQGIASQLMEAMHAWVAEHEYEVVRFECHNQHRPMLHMAIKHGYDIVGIRWDSDRANNLVIFEKSIPSSDR